MSHRLFTENSRDIDSILGFTCRRHNMQAQDAEEFASEAKLRLLEDDYAVLRKFQGQSSLRTYLTVVITRLLLDYRIERWGKWRPSAEAKRQGQVALRLERTLYRDGRSFEEAVHILSDQPRHELERLAGLLPHRQPRRFEGDEKLETMARPEPGAEAELLGRERAAAAREAVRAMREALAGLEPEDRLMLRLRFEQGLSVVEIATTLRVEAKPLYRRIERLLGGLRRDLERAGVDREATLGALGSVWMDEEDGRTAAPAGPAARNPGLASVPTSGGGVGLGGRR